MALSSVPLVDGSPGGLATNSQFQQTGFELRFQSLFAAGRALSFPCDAAGRVNLDALSERARRNYFSLAAWWAATTQCPR